MTKLLLLSLACAPALLSQNQYTQPFYDSLKQGVQVAAQIRQAELQQQTINQVKRHNLAEEQLERDELQARNLSYREVHSDEAQWRINQDVKDAIQACRKAHDDCERLDGMMEIISRAVRPDWTQLTMAEYVECLYAIARNANFGEQARQMLARAR